MIRVLGDELSHYVDHKKGRLPSEVRQGISTGYGDDAHSQSQGYLGKSTNEADYWTFQSGLEGMDFSAANAAAATVGPLERRNFQYMFREVYYRDIGRSADEDWELIGDPARPLRQKHYSRNIYNDLSLATNEMPQKKNVFHTQGPDGEGNRKYISPDGHHEAVYDSNGQLVTNPLNMGTYNFHSPDQPIRHGVYDILPYYIWGNSPKDPTTFSRRFKRSFHNSQ